LFTGFFCLLKKLQQNRYFYGSLSYVFSCEEDAKAVIAISNKNSEFDWDKPLFLTKG
jgi:hypothetical protein